MLTYVFPGQGSQAKGMGKELFDDYRAMTARASDILGYSIKELCVEDPKKQLSQTQFTQPAIYVVSALSYLRYYEKTGVRSDFLAGHSLGEYNALFAADVFDFETGLKLVKKRGELMSRSRAGAMAAVLRSSADEISQILGDNGLDQIDIANFNSTDQVVLSGAMDQIIDAADIFRKAGAKYMQLPVSAAFHSRFMADARRQFSTFLERFTLRPAKIPVVSNVHALPYVMGAEKSTLCDQITHSVRWTDSICYLLEQGDMNFKEIGASKVLTRLISDIKRNRAPKIAA